MTGLRTRTLTDECGTPHAKRVLSVDHSSSYCDGSGQGPTGPDPCRRQAVWAAGFSAIVAGAMNAPAPARKKGPLSGFQRLLKYRLVIPIQRSRDHKTFLARGVGIGLLIGMTPTVGLQMYLIFCIWLLASKGFKWRFNLIVAIAWSWLSNPLTMIPFYYVFYLTGRVMLLDMDSDPSFEHFSDGFGALLSADVGNIGEQFIRWLEQVWAAYGLKVFIGWIPYSLGFGFLGYHLTGRLLKNRKRPEAAPPPQ